MRLLAMCLALSAAAATACLRSTTFRCLNDDDCGAGGACEAVGYCSFANAACADTGRSFSESAGPSLANTCVTGGSRDGGTDPVIQGCPSGYQAIGSSPHRYQALASSSWDRARSACKDASSSAYLAVPDDAAELVNLAAIAATQPFWIGIDDKANRDMFVTQTGTAATFLPWATGQPDQSAPPKDCVNAISMTEIATERCGTSRVAVCECEP